MLKKVEQKSEKKPYYQILLTADQQDQVLHMCEELGERYEAWIEEAEEYGERPFSDRPEVPYMEIVCDTLDQIKKAVAEPIYEGELPLLVLDADQKIHLLSVCADYHGYLADFIGEKIDDNTLKSEIMDDLYTLYLIGNIEGRLLYGGITDGDLKILNDWDEFLEGCKEEEFPPESVIVPDLDKWYKCPDCGHSCQGSELVYHTDEIDYLYVCPACGCIQEDKEIERQLGTEE